VATVPEVPASEVRLARAGEEDAICDVCREGFASSSQGLLSPGTIERQADVYYDPARVRGGIASAGEAPEWQVYVVAVSESGGVLGAAGGGVTGGWSATSTCSTCARRCEDVIGTALLDFVTEQQKAAGASEQWVSVTEGNDLGIPFYLARGFVVRDRVPFVAADDRVVEAHSLRMSRAI
jgi:hypothetical protein